MRREKGWLGDRGGLTMSDRDSRRRREDRSRSGQRKPDRSRTRRRRRSARPRSPSLTPTSVAGTPPAGGLSAELGAIMSASPDRAPPQKEARLPVAPPGFFGDPEFWTGTTRSKAPPQQPPQTAASSAEEPAPPPPPPPPPPGPPPRLATPPRARTPGPQLAAAPSPGPPKDSPPPLPAGWESRRDAIGHVFFQHRETGVSRWDHPGDSQPASRVDALAAIRIELQRLQDSPCPWEEFGSHSGARVWINKHTGASTREPPQEVKERSARMAALRARIDSAPPAPPPKATAPQPESPQPPSNSLAPPGPLAPFPWAPAAAGGANLGVAPKPIGLPPAGSSVSPHTQRLAKRHLDSQAIEVALLQEGRQNLEAPERRRELPPDAETPAQRQLGQARFRSLAELDQAHGAWAARVREQVGHARDGRANMEASFTTECTSQSDLYDLVRNMGIQMAQSAPKGRHPTGLTPPYAFPTGDRNQPAAECTFKTSPVTKLTIQLQNKRTGKVVVRGRRAAFDQNLDEIFMWLGPATDIHVTAPLLATTADQEPQPARLNARQLLAASQDDTRFH